MNLKRKAMVPIWVESLFALFVILLTMYSYDQHTESADEKIKDLQQRDVSQLQAHRFLNLILQTPALVKNHEIAVAELLAYREQDGQYEPLLVDTINKIVINQEFQLILESNGKIVGQYGPALQGKNMYERKVQIPSFTGSQLIAVLKVTSGEI